MRKLILLLALVVLISGCTSTTTIKFSNNAITLEQYVVSSAKPYAGSATSISFDVTNNVDIPVNDIEINFFDLPGFRILNLDCGVGEKREENICFFSSIDPLDFRTVSMTLQAPDKELIRAPTKFTISFYVSYRHSGFRQANIPIIDQVTMKTPTIKYVSSTPSYGPIKVDFEPPLGRETKKGKQIVKEYWGVKGSTFNVKMTFKEVGDSSIGTVLPTNISAGDLTADLTSIHVAEDLPCSFEGSSDHLVANEDVVMGKTLSCNFISDDFEDAEIVSTIQIKFSYTYKYLRTETFTVYPLE